MVTKREEIAEWWRGTISDMLFSRAKEPRDDPYILRANFSDVSASEMRAVKNHTHGKSAASRSTASHFIDVASRAIGLDVCYYQRSRADQKNGRAGSRTFFWAKDFNTAPSAFSSVRCDAVAMVDVDQYVNMNDFLARNYMPHFVYTFQPQSVARSTGEYCYTFNADQKVSYLVSGGGTYVHRVWNYRGDHVMATRRFLGLPVSVALYQLERKQMDEDHQILFLAPSKKWTGLWATLAYLFISGDSLKYLKPSIKGFTRLSVKTGDGIRMETGKCGAFAKASVPHEVDDELASAAVSSKVGLTHPMVKAKMGDERQGSEILYEYHKMVATQHNSDITFHVRETVRDFQWFDNDYDPEARPSMVAFMQPLLDGAFCPALAKSNDRRAVDKRVLAQKNRTEVTPHIRKVVEEFIDFFLDGGKLEHSFVPVDEEEVHARQDRPTQRRILDEAAFLVPEAKTSTFVKREAYTKVNDPRIISTINGPDKRDYSRYLYALADHLKTMPWYAFGKTPIEIAERVAEVCVNAEFVVNTDFSRMDGRVSDVMRYLERRLMHRTFRKEYVSDLNRLMSSQYRLIGRTRFGVTYETGLARLSGSPETSAFNTIGNAFVAFLTLRAMRSDGYYLSPKECWERLGLYGGDDGLSADIPAHLYTKMALKVGQILEAEPIRRGEIGVSFLARMYGPEVWFGDMNSCCDIARAAAKFHVTVHMPSNITPEIKLLDKAYALFLTDKNTPFIGDFVTRVMDFCPVGWVWKNLSGKWMPCTEASVQYPNEHASWMDDLLIKAIPSFEKDEFTDFLRTAANLTELRNVPQVAARVELVLTKVGSVVVDDDLRHVSPPRPAKDTYGDKEKSPRKRGRTHRKPSLKARRAPKGEAQAAQTA